MSLHRGQHFGSFNVPVRPITTSRPSDAGSAGGYARKAVNFDLATKPYQKPAFTSQQTQTSSHQSSLHRSPPIYLQPPTPPQWARQPHYQKAPARSATVAVVAPPVAAHTATRDTMSLDTLNSKFFRLSMEDLVQFLTLLTYHYRDGVTFFRVEGPSK